MVRIRGPAAVTATVCSKWAERLESSVDESLAAHFEHTVAITAEGPKILTKAGAALLR